MRHKTEIETEHDRLLKVARSQIRLEHSLRIEPELYRGMPKQERADIRREATLAADAEINRVLPALSQNFWDGVQEGTLMEYSVDAGELVKKRDLKILDFDCECRPMAFYGGDWVTKEITAIAWKFIGRKGQPKVWLLKPSDTWKDHLEKRRQGLREFVAAYNEADIVTGHFIRGFDLPLVNAACIELGLPSLQAKFSHDTKGDLVRMSGISKSQENLGAHLELDNPKVGMNTYKWEKGNSLVREGRKETRARVVGDVNQHIEFREALIARGALTAPKLWTSGARAEKYHA